MMHEIVTLQFGQQSNYLGTHFWNTQVCLHLLFVAKIRPRVLENWLSNLPVQCLASKSFQTCPRICIAVDSSVIVIVHTHTSSRNHISHIPLNRSHLSIMMSCSDPVLPQMVQIRSHQGPLSTT